MIPHIMTQAYTIVQAEKSWITILESNMATKSPPFSSMIFPAVSLRFGVGFSRILPSLIFPLKPPFIQDGAPQL